MHMQLQPLLLLKKTFAKWNEHNATRLGASVAFYSILSFAPLIVLTTAGIALIFGESHAQGTLIAEAKLLIGDRGAETVKALLENAQKPSSGILASWLAVATLLFGSSGVFVELQDALNIMWEVPAQTHFSVMSILKQRLFSFGMVLSVGFLLLVSLILTAVLTYAGEVFGDIFPMPVVVLQTLNLLISYFVVGLLFALMFKYMPDTHVPWSDALVGAFGTAFLFTIGKSLLALYLGKTGVGSIYGAAGSLVAVVVWIYYSAQIFFFGAEFTHVYMESHQPKIGNGGKKMSRGTSAG
jgi:membrane protein